MQPTSPPQRSILMRLFFSPEEPRLRAGWRLSAHFTILIIFVILFSIPVTLLSLQLLDIPLPIQTGFLSDTSLILGGAIQFLAVTVSVFIARRLIDRRSIGSLGLGLNPQALPDLLAGTLLAGVMIGTMFAIEWLAGWLQLRSFVWQEESLLTIVTGLAGMLVAFILVAWTEELLFRGYWLQNLVEGLNPVWAVLISSAVFSVGHIFNPGFTFAALIGLLVSGVFLAFAYLRTRQLWLPIGLHIGWNFFEGSIFGFETSGMSFFTVIHQQVNGPVVFTGGAFGPEAGLILIPGLAVGTALVYLYTLDRRAEPSHDG